MGEEKEILLRGKVCAYLTGRLMGDPDALLTAAPMLRGTHLPWESSLRGLTYRGVKV